MRGSSPRMTPEEGAAKTDRDLFTEDKPEPVG
jgi:hypothetical protein